MNKENSDILKFIIKTVINIVANKKVDEIIIKIDDK